MPLSGTGSEEIWKGGEIFTGIRLQNVKAEDKESLPHYKRKPRSGHAQGDDRAQLELTVGALSGSTVSPEDSDNVHVFSVE